jgi:hypothetical protein
VLAEIVSDLGGADRLSEGQRQIARRCATISIACERTEGEAAAGDPIEDVEVINAIKPGMATVKLQAKCDMLAQ